MQSLQPEMHLVHFHLFIFVYVSTQHMRDMLSQSVLCKWILHIFTGHACLDIIRWFADLSPPSLPPSIDLERRGRWLLCFLLIPRHTKHTLTQTHTHILTSRTGVLGKVLSWISLTVAAAAGVLGVCCLRCICGTTSAFPSSSRKMRLFYSFDTFHSGKLSVQMTNAL